MVTGLTGYCELFIVVVYHNLILYLYKLFIFAWILLQNIDKLTSSYWAYFSVAITTNGKALDASGEERNHPKGLSFFEFLQNDIFLLEKLVTNIEEDVNLALLYEVDRVIIDFAFIPIFLYDLIDEYVLLHDLYCLVDNLLRKVVSKNLVIFQKIYIRFENEVLFERIVELIN